MHPRKRSSVLRLLLGVGISAALFLAQVAPVFAQAGGSGGHLLEQEEPVSISPRYLLMNPQGRAVTNEDFRGRFQLVAFGFVSCPDVCPTTLLEFKNILEALGEQASRLQPIFVTVDPERDSSEILRAYTGNFDSRILGLTGSPDLVRRAADSFRVKYEKVSEPGAKPDVYTMNHTAGMVLLDPWGSFAARFPYGAPTKEITDRIRLLMASDGVR